MFAVINHLHLTKPLDELAAEAQSEGLPLLSQQPGFRAAYMVQEGPDRCVMVLLWNTAADAENGARNFGPTWFATHIAPFPASEQQRTAGPILAQYESSANQ